VTTLLFSHEACLDHDTGQGHPERSDRLRAVNNALAAEAFSTLDRRQAPEVSRQTLALNHPEAFVEHVFANAPLENQVFLDPDTVMSPGSMEAALRATGAVCAAVDEVAGGNADNAFCAVRPPGHHAEPDRAMGFCLFNSVAIAARHAREKFGMERIAVVDFDVHHGNGTEAAFWDDKNLFYASSHQYPYYPGTGAAGDVGQGNIINVPLATGSGSELFRSAMTELIIPALHDFKPELILISAGFDAHADDPLAQLNLQDVDYGWVTDELLAIADSHAGGRVVSALEGGYDLGALSRSVAVHVKSLMQTGD
jgi:acetoin utilization deacetylase AcuC-like enzyme